jgi:tetratricopeptide (TPR) repeat protein
MSDDFIHSGLTSYIDENYNTAVDQFSKSIQKNENIEQALIYRACSYIQIGDYSSAITDLNYAESLSTNYYEVFYNRAKAFYLCGDFKSSLSDINKLKELNNLTEEQIERVNVLEKKLT